MSAALPPVPDLIPISALRKGSSKIIADNNNVVGVSNNNNNNNSGEEAAVGEEEECGSTQCSVEVMGEQRSRLTGQPVAAVVADAIDTSGSRGGRDGGAAPQPTASRKARTERHRKSDKRRERRKRSASSPSSKHPHHQQEQQEPQKPCSASPPPRVNPIFVWVRQRDTQIVEVKCEDYDKRNRILLTKTAQGWRAIPRTEMTPVLQRSDDNAKSSSSTSSRKVKQKRANGKVKRKTAAVQTGDSQETTSASVNSWSEEQDQEEASVNSGCGDDSSAQGTTVSAECHGVSKCDVAPSDNVTPLDNLLAVAELEFNQQIQQEAEEQINNMEQLDMFIESCTPAATSPSGDPKSKGDDCECDYTEEDDNNLAMDDILSRLEQSLRSPDTLHSEIHEIIKNNAATNAEHAKQQEQPPAKSIPQEVPTDLTTTKEAITTFNQCENSVDDLPTDLSVPKRSSPKRPPSQNSETIQSPQPSGIPAVPPSPDIYHHTTTQHSANKTKNNYLESLLSPNKDSNSNNEKEPLDLGKQRESDSPKVTCSQEVQQQQQQQQQHQQQAQPLEPPPKKVKLEDLTLKRLLHNEKKEDAKNETKNETPRLLELLTHDVDHLDPTAQLKQVLGDAGLNVPDPMLIPKDRLSQILSAPAKEIPKLLTQRPELRLPEALAYPHLLQDPDILVITLSQLETIVQKQSQAIPLVEKDEKKPPESPRSTSSSSNTPSKPSHQPHKEDVVHRPKKAKMSELSSDIDAATNAAFTQMMWLPYLNQLENAAMSFGGNHDFLKLLSTMLPNYPGNPEMSHMMSAGRLPFPPPAFPMQPPLNYNPLELSMWQEAMLQANMARSKNQFDFFGGKDYGGKGLFPKGAVPNPYLNVQGQFQPVPIGPRSNNLQIPQYNPHQKNPGKSRLAPSSSSSSSSKNSYQQQKLYESEKMHHMQHQHQQQQRHKHQELLKQQHDYLKQQELYAAAAKPKVACKPFANITAVQQQHQEAAAVVRRQSTSSRVGPIDLSGSTPTAVTAAAGGAKLKVKQHLVDHAAAAARLLKHDDVPEVGSTTASIEEMQDAQKHLWHPLFGNQKSYSSPWNWTTVTATGE